LAPEKGKFTLGDLLNIFDGICELDGVIYVMTTYHKDMLDPALIRPGRVTVELELTLMKQPEIKEMLTYFYEPKSRQKDINLIDEIAQKIDGQMKPAQVENMCQNMTLNEFYESVQ
jgi:ATP-dependent 26S proteasome regulatory subunit